MNCPRCGTAFEGRFCPNCGADLQPYVYACLRCGAWFGGPACPYCGTPVGEGGLASGLRAVGSIVWSIGTIAFLVLIVIDVAAFVYATSLIVPGALAGGPRYIDLYVLTPFPFGVTYDANADVFLLYFALVAGAILAACLWYAVRDARPTAEAFTRPLSDMKGRMESRSAWVATGQVFMAALFFQIVYILFLAVGGVEASPPTGGVPVPDWYLYFALANASVYEELVTRLIFIGVPLFLVAALIPRARLPADWTVPAWRHLFGGTLNRSSPAPLVVAAIPLVIISSIVFGAAHVPAWGWWKFLPSAVAGLGMGYLFVRRGLLAAILFHFANDYLGAAALLTADSFGAQALLGLLLIVLILLGLFYFAWYSVYVVRLAGDLATRWGLRRPSPAPAAAAAPAYAVPLAPGSASVPVYVPWAPLGPSAPPPPGTVEGPLGMPWYGGAFVAFICPRCGWTQSRYDEGRFTCLRCGHVA